MHAVLVPDRHAVRGEAGRVDVRAVRLLLADVRTRIVRIELPAVSGKRVASRLRGAFGLGCVGLGILRGAVRLVRNRVVRRRGRHVSGDACAPVDYADGHAVARLRRNRLHNRCLRVGAVNAHVRRPARYAGHRRIVVRRLALRLSRSDHGCQLVGSSRHLKRTSVVVISSSTVSPVLHASSCLDTRPLTANAWRR